MIAQAGADLGARSGDDNGHKLCGSAGKPVTECHQVLAPADAGGYDISREAG
jgi:hypothetical protein